MDQTEKRKMLATLRRVLLNGFSGTQEDLCEAMQREGWELTQSTISRALRKVGAIKAAEQGQLVYRLPPPSMQMPPATTLAEQVLHVLSNESMIVVKTVPGAAMFVAAALERACGAEVLGSVAGDDTIFIAPKQVRRIRSISESIKRFISGE